MRGKVCFANARKRKAYKVKAFDLKNTKFKVQKSNNFLQFLDTWDQFSNADFFLLKTPHSQQTKKPHEAPQQQNKPETKQTVSTNVLLMPSLITLL